VSSSQLSDKGIVNAEINKSAKVSFVLSSSDFHWFDPITKLDVTK